jgi:hypothetical protein
VHKKFQMGKCPGQPETALHILMEIFLLAWTAVDDNTGLAVGFRSAPDAKGVATFVTMAGNLFSYQLVADETSRH